MVILSRSSPQETGISKCIFSPSLHTRLSQNTLLNQSNFQVGIIINHREKVNCYEPLIHLQNHFVSGKKNRFGLIKFQEEGISSSQRRGGDSHIGNEGRNDASAIFLFIKKWFYKKKAVSPLLCFLLDKGKRYTLLSTSNVVTFTLHKKKLR